MQSKMFKDLDVSSKTLYMPLLLVIVLFNHALLSEGSRHILERKYYPKELPIKTIMIDDGDIYDCVKLGSQPSMKDPSIQRKIQLREKSALQRPVTTANSSHEPTSDKLRDSRVQLESESCPPGSFPVLKATKGGPLNFSAIEEFASSRARSFLKSKTTEPLIDNVDNPSEHEHAKGSVRGSFGGGDGIFNVWQPILEDTEEMSLSQLWVVTVATGGLFMSREAGWMVNPSIFGDTRTRFFIFTTNDAYKTWLYNDDLRIPVDNNLQFRRVNDYMPLGKRLEPSTVDGTISEIEIAIKRDDDEDWELWVDKTFIGFWPRSNYPVSFATKVAWGGEIVNLRTRGRHTTTQMGSGHFSTEDLGEVAYVRQMGLYDLNGERYDPSETAVDVYMKYPSCYDLTYWNLGQIDVGKDFGHFMTFGGPGYDPENCP